MYNICETILLLENTASVVKVMESCSEFNVDTLYCFLEQLQAIYVFLCSKMRNVFTRGELFYLPPD